MTDFSPLLSLPYLLPNQAQKHVTVNQSLGMLDTLVHLSVTGIGEVTPPASPTEGERLIVGAGATGAFAGKDQQVALHSDGAWLFLPPQAGWRAWDEAQGALYVFTGGAWQAVHSPPDQLPLLGLNMAASPSQRLAVSAASSLFTHEGADHRLLVNRQSEADVASAMFQTGFSGRGEIGLMSDGGLALRTSADGGTWQTRADFPEGEQGLRSPAYRSGRVDVPYESAVSIPTPASGGFFLIFGSGAGFPQIGHAGIVIFDSGSSLQVNTVWAGSKLNVVGTVPLSGTTGLDDFTNISVQTKLIHIENRQFTSDRSYDFIFLC
ncbi:MULTISPECIES: DUF2793 domain-containing protein [Hyphomonas]|uniref:DUF2793 domain-containing protein n=1 Tax=Hyphomonas TaxID=85 RepID=UPI003514423C